MRPLPIRRLFVSFDYDASGNNDNYLPDDIIIPFYEKEHKILSPADVDFIKETCRRKHSEPDATCSIRIRWWEWLTDEKG